MAPKSRLSEAALIKPPTTLSSTILISEGVQLTGTHPIHIGDHTVLHPRCRLNSTLGPITIGDYCILNERTLLAAADEKGLVVEDYVVVEMNAVVEARRIGEGSVVEVGVKNCKFTPLTSIDDAEMVEDDTVVYGYGERRKDMSGSKEARKKLVEKQIDGLRALIQSNRSKFLS
ncbi:hypothetical protein K440DRAFT_605317 [Wilcoxina mikolae CBS 423.85]|nr:hypothetical protein K440DRAFT_605317 [Wilcoxina mikolae CBS 423.85]